MKKKWPILSIFILLAVAICLTIFVQEKRKLHRQSRLNGSYFQISEITQFTKEGIPCINIEIEGKQIEAEIDIGTNVPVFLAKEILNEMSNKKFLGMTTISGMRGIKYQNRYFELSGISLGGAKFQRLQGNEMHPDCRKDSIINPMGNEDVIFKSAQVGWTFFNPMNLYLDCKRSMIAICDSIETLQKNGYLVSCVEAPLITVDDYLIGLMAVTDKGPLRCLLDTGSTRNCLNSAEEMSVDEAYRNPENKILVSSLKIGSLDFGITPFVRAPIKSKSQYDAILGMEFIYSRPMFIDFGKKKIYFAAPAESTEQVVAVHRPSESGVGTVNVPLLLISSGPAGD
jgi:hypothetical protein